jgi:hypothetical protein
MPSNQLSPQQGIRDRREWCVLQWGKSDSNELWALLQWQASYSGSESEVSDYVRRGIGIRSGRWVAEAQDEG